MRELETSLQEFGEFVLKAPLVNEKAAPYCVRWVRRFLTRPASDQSLTDQVCTFCEDLEQHGAYQEWCTRPSRRSASTSSTFSGERTGIGSRAVRSWTSKAGRIPWWLSITCARGFEPGTTRTAPNAATWTGCGTSSGTRPSSRVRPIRASSRRASGIS